MTLTERQLRLRRLRITNALVLVLELGLSAAVMTLAVSSQSPAMFACAMVPVLCIVVVSLTYVIAESQLNIG